MIFRPFTPPNFEVDASEEDGARWKWLTRGSSKEVVAQQLESEGWTVHSISPYDFNEWLNRSTELLADVESTRSGGGIPKFDSKHWQRLKRHLFEIFNRKCAYCEAVARHVSSGDVEHFRPKRRVDDEPDHPGYYWLAYEASNLLPSCERCNRAGAKMNRFPVQAGTRASDPSGIPDERPLLLNPYLDEKPLKHLSFLSTGHVKPLTEKGERSIETYRLARRELVQAREEKIAQMENDLNVGIVKLGLEGAVAERIQELQSGSAEYSAALLSSVSHWISKQQRSLEKVESSLPKALRARAQAKRKRRKGPVAS